jgi:predicted DCC family thiol-disulfide oxidoreductase YuxK
MKQLTVIYDSECGFCNYCRKWVESQYTLLPLVFIPQGSSEAVRYLRGLERTEDKDELVVVSDEGGIYRGSRAFIMCLWALEDYRELSYRLAQPQLLTFARYAFELLSRNRYALSKWLEQMGGSKTINETVPSLI